MGLLCGEGCVILTSTVFDWSTCVTDRQTARRTGDGISSLYFTTMVSHMWQILQEKQKTVWKRLY